MAAVKELGHTDPDYPLYFPRWHNIPHYYGDTVRQLMLGAAALMLLAAPLYTDRFSLQMPFIVLGALVLVGLAALTNPKNRFVMMANAVASGVIVIMYELWSFPAFESGDYITFVLREAPAIVLIFAFYFSMKTLRAMLMNMIGKDAEAGEFGEVKKTEPAARELGAMQVTEGAEPPDIDGIGEIAAEEDDRGSS